MKLKTKERFFLESMFKKGIHSGRVLKRAQILLMLDQAYSSNEIATILKITPETARSKGWFYVKHGLRRALYDAPRPGQKPALSLEQSNKLIAIACSKAPEGYERWSIRLIMEEAYKTKVLKKKVSRETVRLMFHQHNFKPWRKKNVVYPQSA